MKGIIKKNSDPLYRQEVDLETLAGLHELYKGEGHYDVLMDFDVANGYQFKAIVLDSYEGVDVNPESDADQENPQIYISNGNGMIEMYVFGKGIALSPEQATVLIEAIEDNLEQL